MRAGEVARTRASLREEMAAGDLGDARLNARRSRLVTVLEQQPDASFPTACGSASELEACYRFLRNRRVSLARVLAPHVAATQARCAAVGDVWVVHDTSEVSFAGEAPRAGLTHQSRHRQGFLLRATLAVAAADQPVPLGVLGLVPVVRPARARGRRHLPRAVRGALSDKESRGWDASVQAAAAPLGRAVTAIHVIDREGDSYELLAAMQQRGDRFIVRMQHDRRLTTPTLSTLRAALPRTAPVCERTVTLSARRVGDRSPKSRRQHPPRAERTARIQFAAQRVVVPRPPGLQAPVPATLTLHVVYGWEVNPPAGEAPVEWCLLTSEPIATSAQILRVVDGYRARWLIEEFFKALKTGCAYEQRQLEGLHTLSVALGLLAPIAWQLLLLRHLARDAPDTPATTVVTPQQLTVLRAMPAGAILPSEPTVTDVLHAIARLGGHLRQNGPPGWLILTRGMQTLRLLERGWVAAQRVTRCDQS